MKILELKNITFKFKEQILYKNLSFDILKGEKVAITGPSGSGKSTLFNIILGFQDFTEGEIFIFGKKILKENIKSIRSKTCWLPQQVDIHFNTVQELFFAPYELKQNKKIRPSKFDIENIFKNLDLNISLLNKNFNEISGGQKQRIVIASLLLLKKEIYFFDEPTSALDEISIDKFFNLIFSLKNTTFLFATHNPKWIEKADKNIIIDNFQSIQ